MGPHGHTVEYGHEEMQLFLTRLQAGYENVPFTSWFHAVDVTHAVFRFLRILCVEAYLDRVERFALLVAAAGHDFGHMGLNNQFLVETSHELALRYNDRSPLENMHLARLFDLLANNSTNILASLTRKEFQEARRVCIVAILHTDNAHHFAMIKEVQLLYQVNSEMFDETRAFHSVDSNDFPSRDVLDCFRIPETRTLICKLILHVSDLAHSMKPFRVSQVWAWRSLEEMFLIGDAERESRMPVQALHDRHRVNGPNSQIGFIEFVVAPLIIEVVKVMPPIEPCAEHLVDNAKEWHSIWNAKTSPPPKHEEKQALQDRIWRLERRFIEGA